MKRKLSRIRPSPNEEARILKEEHERRRKLRIQQVREQQRQIALQIRQAVEQRRQCELEHLGEELRLDWEQQQREKLDKLQRFYHESLQLVGQGHRDAKENEPDLAAIAQREEVNHAKAEQRHQQALKELKSQRLKDNERQNKSVSARKKALQTEKERSAKVASLPPPPPNPIQNIDFKKPHVVKKSDVSAFAATHYHMPESTVDRQVDTQQCNAHEEADLEVRRLQDLQREATRRRQEQLEKARLRGRQALKREQLVQDRERLLVELEHMQQTDMLRRRQQVSQMPPQIFQPLFMRQEAREDFQREMEFAFEDMYTGERRVKGDLVVQLEPEPLPALSTGSQDQELDVTLDEITTQGPENTSHDAEQEAARTDLDTSAQVEPAKPPPRRALRKLLDRIRSQKNQYTEHSSHVPVADSQTVINDQIPERDTSIETGSLTNSPPSSNGKEKQPSIEPPEPHSAKESETTETSSGGDSIFSDQLRNRIQEFEEEQRKREEELEREKQQQVVLLQELENQKVKLEQMLLEAQQEREHLKAAAKQQVTIDQPDVSEQHQDLPSVCTGQAPELQPPAGEHNHTHRLREYQQRLLEQNGIHQKSVEVARRRLEEYQRALRIRYNMTSTSSLPAVLPSGLTHQPPHRSQSMHLPTSQLLSTPTMSSHGQNQPQTFMEVPTKESDAQTSSLHLPGSSLIAGSKLQPDKMESTSNNSRNHRLEQSVWLTDNIMERVTQHLPERVRLCSPTTQPQHKLSSSTISLQRHPDSTRAIRQSSPPTDHAALGKSGTLSRSALQAASLSSKDDDMERRRLELQDVQRRVLEQREAVVQGQRLQQEERQRQEVQRRRQEVEMEQMRQQKETLQALIDNDSKSTAVGAAEVQVTENIGQTRLRLLASLLKAIEESNGGTLSHLENPQEEDRSNVNTTDPITQTSAPAGPAPASVLSPGLFLPPARAAKPPVTRVRLGTMTTGTDQHELSAIPEVETPLNISQVTGLGDSMNVAWELQEQSDLSVSSVSHTAERTPSSGSSSSRSSHRVWRERVLTGAWTSPEYSESDSFQRKTSHFSSDSGRGADHRGPALTSYRSPTESRHRCGDSDLSSTTISTGSYVTTDLEQNTNTDKPPPLRPCEEQSPRAPCPGSIIGVAAGHHSFLAEGTSAAGRLGSSVEGTSAAGRLSSFIESMSAAGRLGSLAEGTSPAGLPGSLVERTSASGRPGSLVERTSVAGRLGSFIESMSAEGRLGSSIKGTSAAGRLGSFIESMSAAGRLGSSVEGTLDAGRLGSFIESMSAAGRLGSLVEGTSAAGSPGSFIESMSAAGCPGSLAEGTSPAGLPGSLVERMSASGRPGSLVERTSAAGRPGSLVEGTSAAGRLGSSVEGTLAAGRLGSFIERMSASGRPGSLVERTSSAGRPGSLVEGTSAAGRLGSSVEGTLAAGRLGSFIESMSAAGRPGSLVEGTSAAGFPGSLLEGTSVTSCLGSLVESIPAADLPGSLVERTSSAGRPGSLVEGTSAAGRLGSSVEGTLAAGRLGSFIESMSAAGRPGSLVEGTSAAGFPGSLLEGTSVTSCLGSLVESIPAADLPGSLVEGTSAAGHPGSLVEGMSAAGHPGSPVEGSSAAGHRSSLDEEMPAAGRPGSFIETTSVAGRPSSLVEGTSVAGRPGSFIESMSVAGRPGSPVAGRPGSFIESMSTAGLPGSPVAGRPSSFIESMSAAGRLGSLAEGTSPADLPGSLLEGTSVAGRPGSFIESLPAAGLPGSPVEGSSALGRPGSLVEVTSAAGCSGSLVEDPSVAVHPEAVVESLFNDSSIQRIIDRYTRELDVSLSIAGKTTDSEGSSVEEAGSSLSQLSLVRGSERHVEDKGAHGPQTPHLHAAGTRTQSSLQSDTTADLLLAQLSQAEDSFRPLIGQLADQSSCLAVDSAMEQLVGQPTAHSSMIGQLSSAPGRGGWDSTLSRIMSRLSHQWSHSGQLMGPRVEEPSTSWLDEGQEESRMRPLVAELDTDHHSGVSGGFTRLNLGVSAEDSSPLYPALPSEASSHSATAPGVSRHSQEQIPQNQTSPVHLEPENTEVSVFPGSDSFYPLLAEVTHNEMADSLATFHLLEHNVPDSPGGEAAGEGSSESDTRTHPSVESVPSPEHLRAEKAGLHGCCQYQPDESLLSLEDSVRTEVEKTALNLSNLTMCDDDAPDLDGRSRVSENPQDSHAYSENMTTEQCSDLSVPLSDEISETPSEKGILEQSEVTLLSLTDTTLQDQETTIAEEDDDPDDPEGQSCRENEGAESMLAPEESLEDEDQIHPVTFLEFEWDQSRSLQQANQQKCRALLQRSSRRLQDIKAKRTLVKNLLQAPSEAREEAESVACEETIEPEAQQKTNERTKEERTVRESRLKKTDGVKMCAPEQRKRQVSEMYQRTQRLYGQLEEVKQQKTIRSRQEAYAQNRLKAQEFHKKTLQKLRAKQTQQ